MLAAGTDIVWVRAGHFDVDAPAFGGIAMLSALCAIGGLFYDRIRRDERLAAMLTGTSFLLAMSSSFSLLNYLLLTVAGPRIDLSLAAIDRAMGVDWPALMALAAQHPWINACFRLAYISVLPQIALLIVAIGLIGKAERIYALCLSVACGAAISIAIWTIAPSFGAFSVYSLPANVSEHLAVALDSHYAKDLIGLLHNGPGFISPRSAKGLIGFPSYHAALALIVTWYARDVPVVRWPIIAVNAVVMVATPIQGGHHVIDVVAGTGVAALAIIFARSVMARVAKLPRIPVMEPQPAAP
jgi:membrane-associated phospholipid phosphatase